METVLQRCVQDSLSLHLLPNAQFMADRLFYEYPCAANLLTLANCFVAAGDYAAALKLLEAHAPFDMPAYSSTQATAAARAETLTPQWRCHYLQGVCAAKVGRYTDCDRLMRELSATGVGVAATSYWLGVCSRVLGRGKMAESHFVSSYNANPYLWSSFEASVQYFNAFATNPYAAIVDSQSALEKHRAALDHATTAPTCASVAAMQPPCSGLKEPAVNAGKSAGTPVKEKPQGKTSLKTTPVKRPATSTPAVTPTPSQVSTVAADLRSPAASTAAGTATIESTPLSGVTQLMTLLRSFANALKLTFSFSNNEAVALMTSQAMPHQNSGWVLSMAGQASYHAGNNAEARKCFHASLEADPWRIYEPATIQYSTALWHLRAEHELSSMAQQLTQEAPGSPTTMCVVANYYSLLRENKAALAMLSRAIAVDKTLSYGHTLKGLEHLSGEEYGEAEACFREALRFDPRHYMAMAGMGALHAKQENDTKARQYYQLAMNINQLPTVINRYAATFHRYGASNEDLHQACQLYDLAIRRNPNNTVARHQRATLLVKLGLFQTALPDLLSLKESCPDESAVLITLGHCFVGLNNKPLATKAFQRALEKDERRRQYIRACIEKLATSVEDIEAGEH